MARGAFRPRRRPLAPVALTALVLVAAACAVDPAGGADPQTPSRPDGGSESDPAGPAEAGQGGGQGTSAGAAGRAADGASAGATGGDGRLDTSPAGTAGTGTGDGQSGHVSSEAPGDGHGTAVGGGTAGGGSARSDGGGTPPTGSGATGGTGTAGDSAAGPVAPADAPPVAEPGPRFPEPLGLTLTRVAELPVPLALAFRAQEPESLYVALRSGVVARLRSGGGSADAAPALRLDGDAVLDMTARVATEGEMGLLGLAFSPAGDRLYTSSVNRRQTSELWEWPVAPDGGVDAGGGRLVLSLPQPFSNHNGGDVTFGPDGYLYLGFGDGGGGGDPLRAGQDPHGWLGTILRIDPRPGPAGEPYTVPADNPYADGVDGAPEVWLWGARNPWRFSFDLLNGDLWVADVGQDLLEEVTRLPAAAGGAGRGANLGWSAYEGSAPFWSNTEPPGHVRPTVEYRHGEDRRCSVTGGYVYRGGRLPGLTGVYLYSDYCDGALWGYSDTAGAHQLTLARGEPPPGAVLSFGQGPGGEVYVLTPNALWRLEPA